MTPNLALIPTLRDLGYEIHYIGSYQGIERKLIEDAGVPTTAFPQENSAVILI